MPLQPESAGSTLVEHHPVPLWRNHDFMLLWSGQTVSLIGTNASAIAFPLLALALTHSPFQAGLVGMMRGLPFLVLSLPAGALIDRWNRKRIMILCDSARALAFGAIPAAAWSGHLSLPLLYSTALVEGIGFSFFNLAQTAALPRVVPTTQLPAAVAQNQMSLSIGPLIGPPLAGFLYQLGRSLPFLADASSYAVSVFSLLFIQQKFQEERPTEQRSLWTEVAQGMRWLWQQPLIRFMALLTGGIFLTYTASTLVVIVLAKQELHASASAIGATLGVAASGGIVGALLGRKLQQHLSFGQAIIGVCWLVTLLWTLLAFAPNLLVVCILGTAFFLILPTYDIVQFSYRLALIPDELQGRVNSIFRLFSMGGMPLGQAAVGALLQWLGPRPTILVEGAWMALFALAASVSSQVRHAPPLPKGLRFPAK
jgi:MFS family permease